MGFADAYGRTCVGRLDKHRILRQCFFDPTDHGFGIFLIFICVKPSVGRLRDAEFFEKDIGNGFVHAGSRR